ncbi:DUF4859 domain-containing protein [Maribellus mangrovi]|uniref:DUF4859 domain-containing protein n=1 Tax=Maribellus mangrovi TaxID=3133146 RepID=UPI0030EF10C4
MKKISILLILSLIITVGLFSCKDNEGFSNMHDLTEDEIAEIARQDSIAQAQKERINADLVLEYSLDVTISAASYDGGSLEIELDKIAEIFGITEEELIAGIAGESGAPEVKGFAIAGSTHADIAGASNTNAPWGHWWDRRGDLTEWGDSAMVFAEFYPDNGYFTIGQYPGHLTAGQEVTFIEALKYNEIRVAVKITVNAIAAGEITATVVSTQDLSIEVTAKSSYDADSLQFDLAQALTDLGVGSMDEVTFIGVNEDGSYATEYTADPPGYWYDLNGFVGGWGDNASVYTNYGVFADGYIGIGQYPDHLAAGETYNIKYGIMANNKIVMLNITITVAGYIDPETAPEGDPEDVTIDIELSKPYSDDYANVTADIQETFRQAFKMTTYQIHQAIGDGTFKLYQGAISETDPEYTADAPGYWLDGDGTAVGWADGVVWTSVGHSETALWLYGGNHPDNAAAGSTVTTTYIATCNGGSVTINLTFKVEGESTEGPQDLTLTYDISFPADSINYSGTSVSLTANGDIDQVAEALMLDASAIEGALLAAQETPQEGMIAFAAVEPDETLNYATTANGLGFWFDSNGAVIGWGGDNDSKLFSEFTATDFTFNIGQFPGKSTAGDTYTIKEAFVYTKDGVEYLVTFVFNVTID